MKIDKFEEILETCNGGEDFLFSMVNLLREAKSHQSIQKLLRGTSLGARHQKMQGMDVEKAKATLLELANSSVLHVTYREELELQFSVRLLSIALAMQERIIGNLSAELAMLKPGAATNKKEVPAKKAEPKQKDQAKPKGTVSVAEEAA